MNQKNSFFNRFIKYVSLNVISMLGLSLYILADTFFIANGVGSLGLTALNLVLPIYSIVNGIGLLIGMGGATLYSIYSGGGHQEEGDNTYSAAVVMALLAGVIILVAGTIGNSFFVYLLGGRGEVAAYSEIYLKYLFLFSPAFILNNILVCFVRNDNNPKLSMMAMISGSLSNIVLDYIFIFPLQGGMFGAIIATCMAPLISMLILSSHWFTKKKRFQFNQSGISLNCVRKIVSTGIPSFITELSSGIIMLLFNFILLDLSGNMGVAAYGVIANLALIVVAIFTGISQGIQPIIGESYGSGNYQVANQSHRWACFVSVVVGAVCFGLGFFKGNEIIALFNSEGDVALAAIAEKGIRIYFMAFVIMGINMISISFLASVQQVKESFLLSILRGIVFIVPLVFILTRLLEVSGVWLTIPMVEILTFIFTIGYLIKWQKNRLMEEIH